MNGDFPPLQLEQHAPLAALALQEMEQKSAPAQSWGARLLRRAQPEQPARRFSELGGAPRSHTVFWRVVTEATPAGEVQVRLLTREVGYSERPGTYNGDWGQFISCGRFYCFIQGERQAQSETFAAQEVAGIKMEKLRLEELGRAHGQRQAEIEQVLSLLPALNRLSSLRERTVYEALPGEAGEDWNSFHLEVGVNLCLGFLYVSLRETGVRHYGGAECNVGDLTLSWLVETMERMEAHAAMGSERAALAWQRAESEARAQEEDRQHQMELARQSVRAVS